ncbi:hypothetical protein Pan153_06730 [Gimesia panareensis]|uniref:Uncharacterized protein n=1 Tax=Gimesia panareensis TaxID=2527978 RepID=A0A518FI87_9PLAN|nr:hypothetical protein [Gimesia panareensis]QDV16052.1 hypothetical protein Pan153_06730 [Gimesia panareensis]
MSLIEELQFTPGSPGTVKWKSGSHWAKLILPAIQQVKLYDSQDLVLILTGEQACPDTLSAYDYTGQMLFRVPPPEGFAFSYLTDHCQVPIAVVAGSTDGQIDGWYDWHFSVNPQTGKLSRISPAY